MGWDETKHCYTVYRGSCGEPYFDVTGRVSGPHPLLQASMLRHHPAIN
jgi:hypothetical protein